MLKAKSALQVSVKRGRKQGSTEKKCSQKKKLSDEILNSPGSSKKSDQLNIKDNKNNKRLSKKKINEHELSKKSRNAVGKKKKTDNDPSLMHSDSTSVKINCTKSDSGSKHLPNVTVKDECSSESEWEEVESQDQELNIDKYNPEIPKEGVEITLDLPNILEKKTRKKQFDFEAYLQRRLNHFKKEIQICIHKAHLVCLLAYGIYWNNILNADIFIGVALSLIPEKFLNKKNVDMKNISEFVSWFQESFSFEDSSKSNNIPLFKRIIEAFDKKKALSPEDFVSMLIIILRTLGLDIRLCMSFYPLSLKIQKSETSKKVKSIKPCAKKRPKTNSACKKEKQLSDTDESSNISEYSSCESDSVVKSVKTEKNEIKTRRKSNALNNRNTNTTKQESIAFSESSEEDFSDEDFVIPKKKKKVQVPVQTPKNNGGNKKVENYKEATSKKKLKPLNRKILSSDSESSDIEVLYEKKSISFECWIEVYLQVQKKWICVHCINNIFDKPNEIENCSTQSIQYILAFDNSCNVKDVTKRYASKWLTHTRKQRVAEDWWNETLAPYSIYDDKEYEENKQLEATLQQKPLPSTISDFKSHPLYVLKRHLLKFEGIYPPDAPSLGFIKNEAVYSRDCVHTLCSRETWMRQALCVKPGEQPYKIVKGRPKWNKITREKISDRPLELFGIWQTEDFIPPTAQDGKVPRNQYGNVELFQPSMLPKGTVHLQIPALHRVAKKLGIDCAAALVGFEGHGCGVYPVYDGWIVCEEFSEVLKAAWDEDQENIRRNQEEKREKRIYGNWKRLIKGLLIKERIKAKYLKE